MTEKLLKLKAKDIEDMQVISAILQDAIAPVCDMAYLPEEKSFVMVVHRLCREGRETESESGHVRICCAVNLRGVESARIHGIDLHNRELMLDLLAVIPQEKSLELTFAGEAKIRLQLGNWSLILEDFGEPWPALCTPHHDVENGG